MRLLFFIALAIVVQVQAAAQEALFAVGAPGRQLYVLDPLTGAVLFGQTVFNKPDSFWRMTHDGSKIYGIDQAFAFHPDRLFSIHPADAHGNVVGNTNQTWNHYAIEWVPQTNELWVVYADEVYTVDRMTGTPTYHGILSGLNPFDYVIAMAVDQTGIVYATGTALAGNPNLSVYQLNLGTRTAVPIASWPFASFASTGWFADLAFTNSGVLWGVYHSIGTAAHRGLYRVDLQALTAVQVLSQPSSSYYGIAVGPMSTAVIYCTAKIDSLGCIPDVNTQGIASATGVSGFRIDAANVQNAKNGALMYGVNGQATLPFAGGTLCIAAPFLRANLLNSGGSQPPATDCTGVLAIDFNTFLQTQPLVPAGTTFQCQWLSRDPGFAPPNNLSLSNAVEFALLP